MLAGQQESDTLTPSVLIELAAAADTTQAQLTPGIRPYARCHATADRACVRRTSEIDFKV
jgi:hypothetical protein